MALTPKQEAFAQAMANGSTQSDAVRAATDTSNWAQETVWNDGYKMMQIPGVLARIDDLKAELASKALWTKEQSVLALKKVVDYPDRANDIVSAVKELNAMHGYNAPTKQDINMTGEFAVQIVRFTDPDKSTLLDK